MSSQKFDASRLIPGQTYLVVRSFEDYDGFSHPVGERWRFVEKNFLPYEDGLTLNVEFHGKILSIRLQWRDETQGMLIDNFSDYVQEV